MYCTIFLLVLTALFWPKYDKNKHLADIQPLFNDSDGNKSAQYLDVPVSVQCYEFEEWLVPFKKACLSSEYTKHLAPTVPQPKLKVGATVIAVCLDKDIDNWDGGNSTFTPNSSRQHSANDSVIVGVIK